MEEKRLTPFEAGEEDIDYEKIIREFGVERIEDLKNLNMLKGIPQFDKGLLISHRDFDLFLDAVKNKKTVSIVTGANASGSLHIGHLTPFLFALELQRKYNVKVFVPISDDEAYVCKKAETMKAALDNAYLIARQIAALGFDPKLTKIFIHQEYPKIYNLAIKLSKHCTLSTIKAIYGFRDETNAGLMFYPAVQAADILLPQEVLGPHITLVPIGIDQDPHMRLARDLAERCGYVKPAALHMKFIHGVKGGKMSKSRQGSTIFLNENLAQVKKILANVLTGGQETAELQKKFGGKPNLCIVHEYLSVFFDKSTEETKKREKECLSGKLVCGEDKRILIEQMTKFLEDFQKKVERVKIEDFLLK